MTFSMKLRMFFRKPYNVILVLLFAALILLTFLPLLSIVLDTVTVHSSEVMRIRGSHAGDFTDYHWTKVLLDGTTSMSIFYKPLEYRAHLAFDLRNRHFLRRRHGMAHHADRYQV